MGGHSFLWTEFGYLCSWANSFWQGTSSGCCSWFTAPCFLPRRAAQTSARLNCSQVEALFRRCAQCSSLRDGAGNRRSPGWAFSSWTVLWVEVSPIPPLAWQLVTMGAESVRPDDQYWICCLFLPSCWQDVRFGASRTVYLDGWRCRPACRSPFALKIQACS